MPQFLRFYSGYTAELVLKEYAVRFFALVNSMYRLQADALIDGITTVTVGMSDANEREKVIAKLAKSAQGLHGILQEVRVIKK